MMGNKPLIGSHEELKLDVERFSSALGKFAIHVENTLMK